MHVRDASSVAIMTRVLGIEPDQYSIVSRRLALTMGRGTNGTRLETGESAGVCFVLMAGEVLAVRARRSFLPFRGGPVPWLAAAVGVLPNDADTGMV